MRVAYKQLYPTDTPFVINLDKLSEDQTMQVRNKTNEISREALQEILHSPKARVRTVQGIWTSQNQ